MFLLCTLAEFCGVHYPRGGRARENLKFFIAPGSAGSAGVISVPTIFLSLTFFVGGYRVTPADPVDPGLHPVIFHLATFDVASVPD